MDLLKTYKRLFYREQERQNEDPTIPCEMLEAPLPVKAAFVHAFGSLDTKVDDPFIHHMTSNCRVRKCCDNLVVSVTELAPSPAHLEDEYVYDLQTDNHHFSAGCGTIVVHNTDSIFVRFPIIEKMFNDEPAPYTAKEKAKLMKGGTGMLEKDITNKFKAIYEMAEDLAKTISSRCPKPMNIENEKMM